MALSTLVDLVKCVIASTGPGPFTLGPAVQGFRGAEVLIDGAQYSYSVQLGGNYETGQGVFTASTATLTRGVITSSVGGSPVEFGPGARVTFTLLALDLLALSGSLPPGSVVRIDQGGTGAGDAQGARANLGVGARVFGTSWIEAPTADSEILVVFPSDVQGTILADFVDWTYALDGLPVSDYVLSVEIAGTLAGTITIDPAGAIAAVTVSGQDKGVDRGDPVKIAAPADASTAGVGFSFSVVGRIIF